MRVKWESINFAQPAQLSETDTVIQSIKHWMSPPRLGAHCCKTATLPDGKILIVAFDNDSKPTKYLIAPAIPL